MSLRPVHRMQRFFRSVFSTAPSDADAAWASQFMSETEQRVFDRMPPVDRSHSIAVTKAVADHLDRLDLSVEDPDARWILAAALLHDVGKSVAGLGTYGRVVATLSEAFGGADMASVWADKRGMTRKVGLYLQYPTLGADLLAIAGADERVIAWAAEHHRPEEEWNIPLDAGRLLTVADDGRL
ncbi:HD domain-containing protein [soil metagenome]